MASNKKIFTLVGCGCFGLAAAIIGIAAIGVTGLFGVLKSSEAYKISLDQVATRAEAIAALGSPIEPGFMVSGSVSVINDTGSANLVYSVSGPKGSGEVTVAGKRAAGTWTFSKIELKIDGTGEIVDLLPAR